MPPPLSTLHPWIDPSQAEPQNFSLKPDPGHTYFIPELLSMSVCGCRKRRRLGIKVPILTHDEPANRYEGSKDHQSAFPFRLGVTTPRVSSMLSSSPLSVSSGSCGTGGSSSRTEQLGSLRPPRLRTQLSCVTPEPFDNYSQSLLQTPQESGSWSPQSRTFCLCNRQSFIGHPCSLIL